MSEPVLSVVFPSPDEFLSAYESEVSNGGLLVRTKPEGLTPGTQCRVRLEVGALQPVEVKARVVAVARFGVSVEFDERPVDVDRLALSLQAGGAKPTPVGSRRVGQTPPRGSRVKAPSPIISTPISSTPVATAPTPAAMPKPSAGETAPVKAMPETVQAAQTLLAKLAAMTTAQKVTAALEGERNVRLSLLRDLNKTIHAYVLRNPRIALDEVQWAAKRSTLSNEALKTIIEHREWGRNRGVVAALVRNPKLPVSVAVRLLSRVSPEELRAISEGGVREPIMQAARTMLAG